MAVSANENISS